MCQHLPVALALRTCVMFLVLQQLEETMIGESWKTPGSILLMWSWWIAEDIRDECVTAAWWFKPAFSMPLISSILCESSGVLSVSCPVPSAYWYTVHLPNFRLWILLLKLPKSPFLHLQSNSLSLLSAPHSSSQQNKLKQSWTLIYNHNLIFWCVRRQTANSKFVKWRRKEGSFTEIAFAIHASVFTFSRHLYPKWLTDIYPNVHVFGENHTDTGRTCKLHRERPLVPWGFKTKTFLLCGMSANHCSIVPYFAACGIVVFHCHCETALMSFFHLIYLKPFSKNKHFSNNVPLSGNVVTNSTPSTKPLSVYTEFNVTKIWKETVPKQRGWL